MTKLTTIWNGEKIVLHYNSNKTILRALIDEGYQVPYSCETGKCRTCMCKLIEGRVSMGNNRTLSNAQLQQSYILICESRAVTEVVEISFE